MSWQLNWKGDYNAPIIGRIHTRDGKPVQDRFTVSDECEIGTGQVFDGKLVKKPSTYPSESTSFS